VALNCTLDKSPASSSTERLPESLLAGLEDFGVPTSGIIRVVDHEVVFGVTSDGGRR